MTLGWVIAGTIAQLMLGIMSFLLVAFSAAGIANGKTLNKLQMASLNIALYVLPASCFFSAGFVAWRYYQDVTTSAYSWYLMPAPFIGLYLVYAIRLNSKN
jgi:hypothetical protein